MYRDTLASRAEKHAMDNSAPLTDLYELHMVQVYHAQGMEASAVFDFIVRKLPPGRNFLVAAGPAWLTTGSDEAQAIPNRRINHDLTAWVAMA
jgi:hypothetical protein